MGRAARAEIIVFFSLNVQMSDILVAVAGVIA